jgi:hypothetical protein
MKAIKHHHKAHASRVQPFTGPVTIKRPNPAAHGNRTIVLTCSCGAERRVNINGTHDEQGEWSKP